MSEVPLTRSELIVSQPTLEFSMGANGFYRDKGRWRFDPNSLVSARDFFQGQQVSFFGPKGGAQAFFSGQQLEPTILEKAFVQPSAQEAIAKYRKADPSLAYRVAFLMGGVARQLSFDSEWKTVPDRLGYMASLAKLGEIKSGDAIASSLAMHALSEAATGTDPEFARWIYHMSESIRGDLVNPQKTEDLGLSQNARIKGFLTRMNDVPSEPAPNLEQELDVMKDFPTVGAEFHLPEQDPNRNASFWRRVALLNMSQFQRGSYIQLSRLDRGVVEIRMNPSVYPVTIANWRAIRRILPEINEAYFTMTFNRSGEAEDFNWSNAGDTELIHKLKGLGLLTYATLFETVPEQKKGEEVDFGTVYLGQTVRRDSDGFEYTGQWSKAGNGVFGQLGIYAGFGKSFPYLAYYPSVAIADPSVLRHHGKALVGIESLDQAVELEPYERKGVFGRIDRVVEQDLRLNRAVESGRKIYQALK